MSDEYEDCYGDDCGWCDSCYSYNDNDVLPSAFQEYADRRAAYQQELDALAAYALWTLR